MLGTMRFTVTVIFVGLLFGCAPTPITFKATELKKIAKYDAIEYLNSVAQARRKKFPVTVESIAYEKRTDFRVCLFNDEGHIKFYDPYSLIETSPYLKVNMVRVVSESPVINEEGGFVHIHTTQGKEYTCSYLNTRDFNMKKARKIFEALASLGVKIN
ncbi:MAG: hypothetical protein HQL69_00225 [Magnetococcales bacterium]|nr:hypothetical protein [Magnetococcales bacterium]